MANSNKNGLNTKNSDVISLRLNHEVVEMLKEEAEINRVSLNVLASNILYNYVKWDKDARQAGFIPTPKDFLITLLQRVDDNDITEIVKQSRNVIKTQIIFMQKKIDFWNVINWLEMRWRVSGFKQKKFYQNGKFTYIIQHDMGWKWSLYMKLFIETVISDLIKGNIDFDISPSMVIFHISVNQIDSSLVMSNQNDVAVV